MVRPGEFGGLVFVTPAAILRRYDGRDVLAEVFEGVRFSLGGTVAFEAADIGAKVQALTPLEIGAAVGLLVAPETLGGLEGDHRQPLRTGGPSADAHRRQPSDHETQDQLHLIHLITSMLTLDSARVQPPLGYGASYRPAGRSRSGSVPVRPGRTLRSATGSTRIATSGLPRSEIEFARGLRR